MEVQREAGVGCGVEMWEGDKRERGEREWGGEKGKWESERWSGGQREGGGELGDEGRRGG